MGIVNNKKNTAFNKESSDLSINSGSEIWQGKVNFVSEG